MKNKKGFTLVELLAVIVILALIMGIAVVSIGGVLSSSREKTFRETGASLISGVRQQLYVANQVNAGYYSFTSAILESGGLKSPYGGDFNYGTTGTQVGTTGVYYSSTEPTGGCTKTANAYVKLTVANDGTSTYSICLSDGSKFLNETTESSLLDNTAAIS